MDNDIKISSSTKVFLQNAHNVIQQPEIDYSSLMHVVEKKHRLKRHDLRKESFYTKTDLSDQNDPSLDHISSDSMIPIPGMLIEYENSESGDSHPMSNWVAPHGPQWGPALR
jgi:hypothetical protein